MGLVCYNHYDTMNSGWTTASGAILILLTAFFVAAEYALVSSRKQKVEQISKKPSGNSKLLLNALQNKGKYVASAQIGVTLCGLAIGSQVEPKLSGYLEHTLGEAIPSWVAFIISLFLVVFPTVVLGELVPKYAAMANPEKVALWLMRPFHLFTVIFGPIAKLTQICGVAILAPFVPKKSFDEEDQVSMEELMIMVRTGRSEGVMDESHANVVSKALRFDNLDASDIMIHRIDIKWLDVSTPWSEIIPAMSGQMHTRIPICNGDIDEIVGILYTNDIISNLNNSEIKLIDLCREPVMIPENLSLTKIIERMRESRTQILIVSDEYGGTSGLITLEDVIEEVFGEMEDQLENDRPVIERTASNRLSARAEVRIDELTDFLEITDAGDDKTETLAEMMIDSLQRMPKMGDRVQTEIGIFIVENMARRRITRVRILLDSKQNETE